METFESMLVVSYNIVQFQVFPYMFTNDVPKNLEHTQVRETGKYFSAMFWLPFLNMGLMYAFNQSPGSEPVSIDCLNMVVSMVASSRANSFRTIQVIPSGPQAFLGFMFPSSLATPVGSITRSWMAGKLGPLMLGWALLSSTVNTD